MITHRKVRNVLLSFGLNIALVLAFAFVLWFTVPPKAFKANSEGSANVFSSRSHH